MKLSVTVSRHVVHSCGNHRRKKSKMVPAKSAKPAWNVLCATSRRMGGQEDQPDATVRSLRPVPDQAGVMVAGVVRDDMDPLVAGIAGLQLLKQRDGGSGVDPLGRDRGQGQFSGLSAAWRLRRGRPAVRFNAPLSPFRGQPSAPGGTGGAPHRGFRSGAASPPARPGSPSRLEIHPESCPGRSHPRQNGQNFFGFCRGLGMLGNRRQRITRSPHAHNRERPHCARFRGVKLADRSHPGGRSFSGSRHSRCQH